MEPLPAPSHLERPAWKDVAYGSVSGRSGGCQSSIMCNSLQAAGSVAKLFEHPFDLVKVRLQSQPWVNDKPASFTGPVDCFAKTFRAEGIRGLYRGLSMPVMGAMAENATLFVTYNQVQQLLANIFPYDSKTTATPISHLCAAGAGAGLAVSYVLTPVELVKCRMQVQMLAPQFDGYRSKPPGPATIASQILRENGFKGLWLGQTGTLLREVGGSIAWFLTFELACREFVKLRASPTATKADLGPLELMPSGAAAGVGYTVVLFPADTIKSTIQTARELRPLDQPRSFIQTGLGIYRSKGLRGLYQGCAVTCVRSSGSSALIFSIYALLESKFG